MKKVLTVAILFVMLMAVAMTVVNAATMDTLANDIYAIGAKYGMTAGQKHQIEIILANRDLSNTECNDILAYANKIAKIMDANNIKTYAEAIKAPANVREELKALAISAGKIANVTPVFTAEGIEVVDNETGRTLTTFTDPGKAPYTGSNSIVVIASVAVIALVAAAVTKKALAANA